LFILHIYSTSNLHTDFAAMKFSEVTVFLSTTSSCKQMPGYN